MKKNSFFYFTRQEKKFAKEALKNCYERIRNGDAKYLKLREK